MDRQDPINGVYIGLAPFPVILANEGLQGSPTKHVKILVVTLPEKGGTTQRIRLFVADPLELKSRLTIAGKGTLGNVGGSTEH